MIIKKFLGKTEEEAVEAAKKELGEGIVIMNVRLEKPKGLFTAFKAKQTEVTVALEEERESVRVPRRSPEQEAVKQVAQVVAAKSAQPAEKSSIEQKLDSLQLLLENQIKQKGEISGDITLPDQAQDTESKHVDKKSESAEDEEKDKKNEEQEKFVRLLYNTMIENEVDEKYANQILEDVDKNRKPNTPFDYILASIYQKIILKFGKPEGIMPAENEPKVVVFLGPTGVGKTTTIAKLASDFVVEQKKKTALLTTDTYRIAAAEQLRTYAQILEVPFRVIYSPEELTQAVDDFSDYDYILVDTAGHSHQNAEQLQGMKEFLDALEEKKRKTQNFLVLSATTKYKDLLKIAGNYKEIASYQLIFTKLDETTTLGNLLNVKLFADAPIAYVTCGQNVPNDIERFNPQKTVKQLLGGKA